MKSYILAYDLGTGGNKASLYDERGTCIASGFESYETLYPEVGWHEQRPADYWLWCMPQRSSSMKHLWM